MNIGILGATRGIGRELAGLMAARGDRLVALGRDAVALEKLTGDLRNEGAALAASVLCDLAQPDSFDDALAEAQKELGTLDMVVLTAAAFAPQSALENDPERAESILELNFTNSVLFCEAARRLLLGQGGGTLCVFSSVAGDKPRKPVLLYGATKAGLSYYLDALDLTFAEKGLRVVTVKPGFVRTDMTAGLEPPPFAADADEVARVILRGLDRKRRVIYAPGIWRLIMTVMRSIPRFVFRRLNV